MRDYFLIYDTCCGELMDEVAVADSIDAALKFIYDVGWCNPPKYECLVIMPIDSDRGEKLFNSCDRVISL